MKICSVIVTYGDRFKLLKKVIDACFRENIVKVIVVDNASNKNSRKQLTELEKTLKGQLEVIHLDKNRGSAEGYKIGLEKAKNCKECEFILLLDDDNLLEEGALKKYISYYQKLKYNTNREVAILGFRDSRPQYVNVVNSCSGNLLLEPKNSFVGFHLFYYPYKIFCTKLKPKAAKSKKCNYVKVPTAPFGGLFFKKDILETVGLPDKEYYLYEDDTDFTYRMTLNGIEIFLIPEIKVIDLDDYWCKKSEKGHPYFTGSEDRFYYFIRNKLFFQKKYRVNNKFIFNLNKYIYNFRMLFLSIINKNLQRFHLYRRAKNDSFHKKMGKRKKKILFISHVLDCSGAPRSLFNLIKYMPKDDIEIELLAMRRANLKQEFEKILNKKVIILTKSPPNNKMLKLLERIYTIPKLVWYILKVNPDLVFINSAANSRAITISKLLGYKTFVFVREFNKEFVFLPKIRRKAIKFADKVFCLSKLHKSWLEKEVGYKKEINILPNGIDLSDVEALSTEEPEESFKKFTKKFDFIVVTVGYLTIRKGWDFFLEIIKKLKDEKDTGFVIIGDFIDKKERAKFLKEIEKHNLTDRIYITGLTENIFKYLKYCHLTAITSRSETFSRVALESMSLGIPFVFFDVGAIKIVPPENYKYKVKPFDIETYVKFIKEIKSLKCKDELSKTLKSRAMDFDIKAISEKFYTKIIGK